ncbi:HD domain-containing protein [Candidatus Micrarchaeota archaeon]|nr:HD domain-containing protein [Candidatus Micrarchaeota archaeon]
MGIVDEIKTFVEQECNKPTSKYGYEPFPYHFTPTVKYAGQLADVLGGDKEVILIAAWMHDIGSIVHGRDDHHITGARIAEEKLKELKYPEEKIELVKKCILNHRGSQNRERKSLEEQIIAEADTMSTFDNLSGLFKAAFVYEHLDQKEANTSVKEKMKRKWNQLHFEKSKEILKPKYEAAMLLLE